MKNTNIKQIACAGIAAVLLLTGGLCYLIWNTKITILQWLNYTIPTIGKTVQCRVLTSFGADFCWAAAFPFAVQTIMKLEQRKTPLLLLCALLGMLYELLQLMQIAAGTADPWDVVIYCIGTGIAVCIINIMWRNQYEKVEKDDSACSGVSHVSSGSTGQRG